MTTSRTQVGIVGAGPAGLLLAHLLHLEGIESIVIENRSEEYVIDRVRAGVLEQGTADLLCAAGIGGRLKREGLVHRGLYLRFDGTRHRIDLAGLAGGRAITIYGQNEVVRDLIAARRQTGQPLYFEATDVSIHDLNTAGPRILYRHGGESRELVCDFIAGCDGFHGISRPSIPDSALTTYDRRYPFGWLGIVAEASPSSDELVYSWTERGFALFSMRSPRITRLYLQCAPDEDMAKWPDAKIWDELMVRLESNDGWKPNIGPVLLKGVTEMRSFVVEPMQFGALFLAGDAAHIVPPTGAKGLNLAAFDVFVLARGLRAFFRSGNRGELSRYSDTCLRRVWRAQRFSWWMTSLLHLHEGNSFDRRRQRADLDYLTGSTAAMTSLAESYVGAPFE